MKHLMKLSIITVNYNNREGLIRTIESVIHQSFTDFEFIIIDGGSSDGSVEVLQDYAQHFSHWAAEKDKGIYDAMNKGILLASGEYLLMLNSGDYLVNDDILEKVFIPAAYGTDIIYGNLLWEENGVYTEEHFPDKLSFNVFRTQSLGHQAAFIKKTVHSKAGLYDDNLKIAADWKFFLLAVCRFNCTYKHIPFIISICGKDGVSCDPENLPVIIAEKNEVLNNTFPAFLPDYILAEEEKIILEQQIGKLNAIAERRLVKMYSKLIAFKNKFT